MTLDEGRMVYWSRSRQEVWRKGDTSGDRQFVREAYYDCDGDTLLFMVEQEGNGRLPHRRAYSCFFRRPSADERSAACASDAATSSTRWPAEHTIVPVWTEVLADLETPVAAYAKLVGDGPGFLLESVEHGERWSRYCFVGRNPTATLELRNGVDRDVDGDAARRRSRPIEGMLAALDDAAARSTERRSFADLPPLQGGVMGYLGYDVIREVEHLPDVPHDDRSCPTR